MVNLFESIFGVGKELTAVQMSARAFVFFFITIIYLRIAGLRTLGRKSSIDMVIVIILGSVIARGIAGASGFGGTLASSLVLVIIHRLVSWLAYKSKRLEKLVKGEKLLLYNDGSFVNRNMQKAGITEHDLLEALRLLMQKEQLKDVKAVYMETNGQLSFITQ